MRRIFTWLSSVPALALVGAIGCNAPPSDDAMTGDDQNVTSSADRDCRVVLREARRASTARGPVEIVDGKQIWTAIVDVSEAAAAEGASPRLQVRTSNADGPGPQAWQELAPTGPATSAPGFQRYTFKIAGIEDGRSAAAMEALRIEMIPFVTLESGARLFDHNRVADDLGSYVLAYRDNQLAIGEDAAVCPSGR